MPESHDDIPTSPHPPTPPSRPTPSEAPTSGGAGFAAPSVKDLAAAFPNLEILEPLGQGGMGAVYKARQKTLDRVVALKILPPGRAGDAGFAERFTREAQALARLNHPGIVAVYDSGHASTSVGELYYFVMEYVDGPNLRALMRGGHIKPSQAVELTRQVCEALAYAHEEGIVHRDIKPENVLVDARLRVKVADFGLAKLLSRPAEASTLTRADAVMGTLQYMAPEQVEAPLTVGPPADLYAAGVMLYEMLTGELPLGRFDPPSVRGADVRLDPIVLRALEKAPGKRYSSAADMGAALGAVSARTVGPVHSPTAQPRRLPGRWVVGAAAVALAGVAVVVVMAIRAGEATPPATPTPPAAGGGAGGGSGGKAARENAPGPHGKRLVEFRGANLALSERAVQMLELAGPDRVKVEALMRATVASVVKLERSHSKVARTDAGRVRVEVLPYVKEATDERARFARELSGLLTEKQRLSLSSGRPVSELAGEKGQPADEFAKWVEGTAGGFDDLFSGSERGRVLEMWKEGETYHLTDSASRAKDPEQTGLSATVFPPRYRPYWVLYGSESADLAELVAELGKDPGRKRPGDRLRMAEKIRTLPNGEARVRKLLEDAGMEAPAAAGPAQLAGRLEQLARSLQGLPELEEER